MKFSKPKTIVEYIKQAPKEAQPKLKQLLATLRVAAPKAEESLKWSMPALSYQRILVTFAVFKNHIGFYPTPEPLVKFKKDLEKFKTARGSVQFPLDKPLPLNLIKKITEYRVKQSREKDLSGNPSKL